MSGDSKFFLGVIIAAVLVIGGVILFSGDKKPVGDNVEINTSVGQKLGPDDAKVKIVEFGDFQCPACQIASTEYRQVQKENADVQLIFRHFPLTNIHQNAESSSLAAYAASQQGKFWEMYDMLYERQQEWQGVTTPAATFAGYAKLLGMDEAKFNSDQSSDAGKKVVKADLDYGLSINVEQTPTFFVNGKRITGAQSPAKWKEILEEARK